MSSHDSDEEVYSIPGGQMTEPLKRLFTRDVYYAMAEAGILTFGIGWSSSREKSSA
jgi:hypothetical protein